MDEHGPSEQPQTQDQPRFSLSRLRAKLRERTGPTHGAVRRSEQDLLQVKYPLAERQLREQLEKELNDRERLAEAHLDAPWQGVAMSQEIVRSPHINPVLNLIARELNRHPEVELAGADVASPPVWERFELGDEVELVPKWAAIYWDRGTVAEVPLVLETWRKNQSQTVQVLSKAADQEAAKDFLERLIREATGPSSPYRGRLLKASWGAQGVDLEILREPTDRREDLVLPREIWDALDLNVHRMFERMAALRDAGLGSNRGVLLAGPPGTGKTASCRVLAREVLGNVTAVFVDSRLAFGLLPQLYREISGLGPALLMIEDLDLVVGDRDEGRPGGPLLDFLTVLDGLMTQHQDVVTVATTNDPAAVDAGVRRAARFDRIVTFPLPDAAARQRILEVYLRSIEHDVDTARVAEAAEGKTGADLREYVRSAVLNASGIIDTTIVLRMLEDDVRPRPNGHKPPRSSREYL
jgi:cell division protease FtsH